MFKFNSNSGVPSGLISQWHGTIASIPSGWLLCDGNNGTPDLRDKFIVGAKQDSGGVAKTNITGSLLQSGGANTHTHTGTTGTATEHHDALDDPGANFALTIHVHNFTTDSSTNIPTFYALAYIMKS